MIKLKKTGCAFLLFALLVSAKHNEANTLISTEGPAPAFRVIGYLRETDVSNGQGANLDFSKITHLNIAFINPDSTGNFSELAGLGAVVRNAHKKNVKVLASIGGGSAPAYYTALLSDNKRPEFIKQLVKVAVINSLDGIDVDLEGERIDNHYEVFISELSAALKLKGKMLTAAVATAYQSRYSDHVLSYMDFINIMSYDKTGPWKPENPGQHAPYQMAVDDLEYWDHTRGIAKERLNLGVPFYGYGFGKDAPADISFQELITQYPGAENTDQVDVKGGGVIYYNGIPTIQKKTVLAIQQSGGIMIWQLFQDASGSNSLLNTIHTVISRKNKQ